MDIEKISKISTKVLTEPKEESNESRRSAAIILLTARVLPLRAVPQHIYDDFIDALLEDKEIYETTKEVSYALHAIASRARSGTRHISLVQYYMRNCGFKTSTQANLHLVLIAAAQDPQLIDKLYAQEVAKLAFTYIISVVPSIMMGGLRIFEQSAIFFPDDSWALVAQPTFEHIINRFKLVAFNPPASRQEARAIVAAQKRGKVTYTYIDMLRIPPSNAAFVSYAQTIAGMLRNAPESSEAAKIINEEILVCLAQSGEVYNYGIKALDSKIATGSDEQEKQGFLLDVLLAWIESNKKERPPQSSYDGWMGILEKHLKPSLAASILCFQLLKMSSVFYNPFISLAKFVNKHKTQEVLEIVSSASILFETQSKRKCHAKALELLANGDDISKAIQLAGFDRDCEESDNIIKSL